MAIPKSGYCYSLHYRVFDSCLFVGTTMNIDERIIKHKKQTFKNDKLNSFLKRNNINFSRDICVNILMYDENPEDLSMDEYKLFLKKYEQKYIENLEPFYNKKLLR